MERRSLEVPRGHAGSAVARIVHDGLGVPHSTAKGLIDAGCVTINGRPVKGAGQRCEGGDVVEVRFDPNRRYHPLPEPRHGHGFRVVHEDAQIVVVDKMPGVLSTPAPGDSDESLAERIAGSLRQRGIKRPQVFVVHRLDRHTSGLLVFAKTPRALESLSAQFESREAGRVYTALVAGRMERDRGTSVSWLAEDPRSLSVRTTALRGAGKRAVTHFEVLERFADSSLVRVRLETGRKHQIRVHFAEIGHPVLGDRRYGEASKAIQRVALHAERLTFRHPTNLETVSYEAPSPEDLKNLLDHLRREGGRRVSEDADAGSIVTVRGTGLARGASTATGAVPARIPTFPQGLALLDATGDPTRTKGGAGAAVAPKRPGSSTPWARRGAGRALGGAGAGRDAVRGAAQDRPFPETRETARDSARSSAARAAAQGETRRSGPDPGRRYTGKPAAREAARNPSRWPGRDAAGEVARDGGGGPSARGADPRSNAYRESRREFVREGGRGDTGRDHPPESKPFRKPRGEIARDNGPGEAVGDRRSESKPYGEPRREFIRDGSLGDTAKDHQAKSKPFQRPRGELARDGWRREAGGKAPTGEVDRRSFSGSPGAAHDRRPWRNDRPKVGVGGEKAFVAGSEAQRARLARARGVGFKPKFDRRGPEGADGRETGHGRERSKTPARGQKSWGRDHGGGSRRAGKSEIHAGGAEPRDRTGGQAGASGSGEVRPPRARKPWEFKQKGMTLRRERRRLIASSKRKSKRNH